VALISRKAEALEEGAKRASERASLRRTHPKVKTLQMVAPASGFVNHPQPAEGSDFVRKPFTPAVLARKLRLLLDGEKRTA